MTFVILNDDVIVEYRKRIVPVSFSHSHLGRKFCVQVSSSEGINLFIKPL